MNINNEKCACVVNENGMEWMDGTAIAKTKNGEKQTFSVVTGWKKENREDYICV